jgi:hypothetical protein
MTLATKLGVLGWLAMGGVMCSLASVEGTEGVGGGRSVGGSGGLGGVGGDVGGMSGVGGLGGDGGVGGTGGSSTIPAIVINEIVADPLPNEEDWFELYNADTVSIDISGWTLSDGMNNYTFVPGTSVPASAYLVRIRSTLSAPQLDSFEFGFSKKGENLTLYTDTNAKVDQTAWADGQADQPMSWGRLPNGTGSFTALTPTQGGMNSQ